MIKTTFTIMCLVVSFLVLSNCSLFKKDDKPTYAVDSMVIANDLNLFQSHFDKALLILHSAQERTPPVFSDEEWKTISNFCGAVNFIAQEQTLSKLQLKHINDDTLKTIVELAQNGYVDCYNIIVKHWDSFSPDVQLELKTLNTTANDLNKALSDLYGKASTSSTNNTEVLAIIMSVLSIAIKILAVAAA